MLRIHVAAHPGARREWVDLLDGDVLGVWVRARSIDGLANRAIELAIAGALGLRPRHVRLVAGEMSRHKIFEIDALSLDALRARLLAQPAHADSATHSDSD